MSEQTASLSFSGLEELQEKFESLVKKYPDRAGELLQKNARELRKDVVKEVKKETKTKGKSKRSLAKVGSYKISKVQGFGANQFVEISAKSPHFHLVEHGHDLIIRGQNRGFVQGKHVMKVVVRRTDAKMPETVEKMIDELLKEGGLK